MRIAKLKEEEKKKAELKKKRDKEISNMISDSFQEIHEREIEIFDHYEAELAQFILHQIQMDIEAKEIEVIIQREEQKRKEKERLLNELRMQEEERKKIIAEEREKDEKEMKERVFKELQLIKELELKNIMNRNEEKVNKNEDEDNAKLLKVCLIIF